MQMKQLELQSTCRSALSRSFPQMSFMRLINLFACPQAEEHCQASVQMMA